MREIANWGRFFNPSAVVVVLQIVSTWEKTVESLRWHSLYSFFLGLLFRFHVKVLANVWHAIDNVNLICNYVFDLSPIRLIRFPFILQVFGIQHKICLERLSVIILI